MSNKTIMKKEITVRLKNVYGNELIYPICEQAFLFAQLINKKTFSANDINIIRALGYTVHFSSIVLEYSNN